MTREQKIHWLENVVFENGGKYELGKIMPISYGDTKYDTASSLACYMGEPLMVYLDLAGKNVPITEITDGGVDVLFHEVFS
jgi:hypothetical protein